MSVVIISSLPPFLTGCLQFLVDLLFNSVALLTLLFFAATLTNTVAQMSLEVILGRKLLWKKTHVKTVVYTDAFLC